MNRIKYFALSAAIIISLPLLSNGVMAQDGGSADSTIALPTEWSTYYVILIKKGPVQPSALTADSLKALMNRHIQYQLGLLKDGLAVAGGGFAKETEEATGMTILKVDTYEKARHLAKSDPAVKSGLRSVSVRKWYVPAGLLPE